MSMILRRLKILTAVFGAAFLAAFGFGCAQKKSIGDSDKQAALPAIQVAMVTRSTLEQKVMVSGILNVPQSQEAVLVPQVTGTLTQLPVRYGQQITRGQVVASISAGQTTGQIQQAEATLGQNLVQVRQAQANALQQRAQTQTSILQAQASVANAEAAVSSARSTLTADKATLRNAQQSLERARTLYSEGLVAQKDVEAAQVAVQTAQAQVEAQQQTIVGLQQSVKGQQQALKAAQAGGLQDVVKAEDVQVAGQQVNNARGALTAMRRQLSLYVLHSPLSGRVTAVGAAVGETVDTTTKIVTISNLASLQLQLNVPSDAAQQILVGDPVTFTIDGLPGRTFHTVVQLVSPQIDPASGTVPVLASISNGGEVIKDDITVSSSVVTARRLDVLTVPASAVQTDPDTGKHTVAVVGADDVLHLIEVKIGLSAVGKTEITSGLTMGQRVAVSGQYGLDDGTKVAVQISGKTSTNGS